MNPAGSEALLTDLYQLTMLQAYHDEGLAETAVFELFVRKLPPGRNFLLACGLEQALDFLEGLRFGDDDIAWLRTAGGFSEAFLASLARLRFTGDVNAMPEGTIFFPDEPIVQVVAPLPQAQLVESRLLNLVHFQTLVASKAARCALAAPGRLLVDFGMRRAHGAEAALLAARAAYVAGFGGTATALAGLRFGIPVFGTMAHSFVEAHATEREAFLAFAASRPENVILLIDTYDTEAAAHKAVALAPELARRGVRLRGVRLDSGDLAEHARRVRTILDAGGLAETTVFCSGNLDEERIESLLGAGAPIDGFGIGTHLDTSSDAPFLDAVYKLQEYAGEARRKRSENKATWPGRKQVYRQRGADGDFADRVALASEPSPAGEPLLVPAMRGGRRVAPPEPLPAIRERVRQGLAGLPPPLRELAAVMPPVVPVISPALRELATAIDRASH
jgi:nicotinate phosphoribosyltransferase